MTGLSMTGAMLALAVVTGSPAVAKVSHGDSSDGVGATSIQTTATYWNDVLLEAFRRASGQPGRLTRLAAIMHTGVFDALNSAMLSQTGSAPYDGYLTTVRVSSSVNADLAAGITARDLLIWVMPGLETYFQQKFTERYGTASQTAASNLASKVVKELQNARGNDGVSGIPYPIDYRPGAWQPTSECITPDVDWPWSSLAPFAMTSPAQFRQPPLASDYQTLLASDTYRSQLAEARNLGAANSTVRTVAQTEAAFFWSNDQDSTYKLPGQLLDHTRIVATAATTDGLRLSRFFALVSLSMVDATIAAWDMKYRTSIDLWRPETAIRYDSVNPDPNWRSLGAAPCTPSWVSAHAALASAWAGIMRSELGDLVNFTVTTEDPRAAGVTRTYGSFSAAAAEHASSRIWLGVSFRWGTDDGATTGYGIASYVHSNYLRPRP
jgi:hypothetical protein